MRQIDLFEWHLDMIFKDSYPDISKAMILDAFHKSSPNSLSLINDKTELPKIKDSDIGWK